MAPFRIGPDYPDRTKIAFTTFNLMPSLIHMAAEATGCASNTEYIQRALCRCIADDLSIDEASLLRRLPPSRRTATGGVAELTPRVEEVK